ncbi:integrating conjugative element protein [Pseudomonas sp. SIMBA_059]
MKCTLSMGALTLVFSTLSWASMNGVEDSGWISTAAHPPLNPPTKRTSTKATALPLIRLAPYSEADMLPVKSERLSPGKVENREANNPGLAPIFLIGDDDLSRRWLTSRKEVLRQLNAVGLVVNVQRLEALTELRDLGTGLDMVPVSADELAERLDIQHYPLLITATGIEQ